MAGLRIAIYHDLPAGGAKRTLRDMARGLSLAHDLDCYSLSCSCHGFCDLRPYMQRTRIYPFRSTPLLRSPLGRVNALLRSWDIARLTRLERRIAADIDAGGYDVVFVHPSQFTQAPALLRFLRTPSVYYCQEPLRRLWEPEGYHKRNEIKTWRSGLDRIDPARALYHGLLRWTDRAGAGGATCVVVNSRFSKRNVKRIYGLDARVCYHGVDGALFEPRALRRNGTVLSVGSLTPVKGHDLIVRALAEMPSRVRPRLLIVSHVDNEVERAHLCALAHEGGVELSVRLGVTDEVLVELYNRARVTACAAHREPFGLVPLESMACGTPVVGVREGGIAESILDGETGLLVERQPEAFARALQTICTNPALASRLGARGREYVQTHWTWDRRLTFLEEQLVEVAQMDPAGGPTTGPKEESGA